MHAMRLCNTPIQKTLDLFRNETPWVRVRNVLLSRGRTGCHRQYGPQRAEGPSLEGQLGAANEDARPARRKQSRRVPILPKILQITDLYAFSLGVRRLAQAVCKTLGRERRRFVAFSSTCRRSTILIVINVQATNFVVQGGKAAQVQKVQTKMQQWRSERPTITISGGPLRPIPNTQTAH